MKKLPNVILMSLKAIGVTQPEDFSELTDEDIPNDCFCTVQNFEIPFIVVGKIKSIAHHYRASAGRNTASTSNMQNVSNGIQRRIAKCTGVLTVEFEKLFPNILNGAKVATSVPDNSSTLDAFSRNSLLIRLDSNHSQSVLTPNDPQIHVRRLQTRSSRRSRRQT
ncbi:unnamed protein product [Chironomus riparius]|uniref:Uncharacterized protein n=1 Tax=Chironomus riparius TaxID=315576 RepID=A0A9N9RZP5_9DIPT|nr:unnamed protein product [Chironomus riparius]